MEERRRGREGKEGRREGMMYFESKPFFKKVFQALPNMKIVIVRCTVVRSLKGLTMVTTVSSLLLHQAMLLIKSSFRLLLLRVVSFLNFCLLCLAIFPLGPLVCDRLFLGEVVPCPIVC